jgi:hypothetical protein
MCRGAWRHGRAYGRMGWIGLDVRRCMDAWAGLDWMRALHGRMETWQGLMDAWADARHCMGAMGALWDAWAGWGLMRAAAWAHGGLEGLQGLMGRMETWQGIMGRMGWLGLMRNAAWAGHAWVSSGASTDNALRAPRCTHVQQC